MHKEVKEFNDEREKLNNLVLKNANNTVKRFFSLDSQTYRDGVLSSKTKEMIGLGAVMI